ncbi:hypothetical protein [Defluviitalea saccharophila]|uniref:Cellobiose phosphorylase n=1 Tax=Defluviitalea saccharophila TaxID=879970 RepID=A0ABZ2Y8A3_9FIRM
MKPFDSRNRFIIKNYMKQSPFASFLPGISGEMGIPVWCFYVNRGQAIASFGIRDKDHSIMEFYPAHQSYQLTSILGFRTFIKLDGKIYEPFQNPETEHCMYIGSNELEIQERNKALKLQTNVLYYTLPEESVGALVRVLTVTNEDTVSKKIELLDGMPAILPYGVDLEQMKMMGQTIKAWMQVEDIKDDVPYFRVRFSTGDTAVVHPIEGGNFYFTIGEDGNTLPCIVDPTAIFSYDTSMRRAYGFEKYPLRELFEMEQATSNQVPCSFFGREAILEAGKSITLYSIIGQCENKSLLYKFLNQKLDKSYFINKRETSYKLTEDLGSVIGTETANPIFDAYCRQTYIDNVLRGGFPIQLGEDKIFYIYSRKHGDLERDYNYFCMEPEYYSQGNGNYRDINQNRRCDVLFTPYVKDINIKMFYNLIQLDGFNPLIINMKTYQLPKIKNKEIEPLVASRDYEKLIHQLNSPYTPGGIIKFIERNDIELLVHVKEFLEKIISFSEEQDNVTFGEGYWTDHWVYNLDLIEAYLSVYPEDKEHLLFDDISYTYHESKAAVLPRSQRYQVTEKGVRQYTFLDEVIKKDVTHDKVRTAYGKGQIYYSALMTKLMILAVNKFASLDPYGLGIEMEGGKPGWYDALNGLPGILGSSMTETYELLRMLLFMQNAVGEFNRSITFPVEVKIFMNNIELALKRFEESHNHLQLWDEMNEAKEAYREQILFGIEGREEALSAAECLKHLNKWIEFLKNSIERAKVFSKNPCPTYFYYEMDEYEFKEGRVIPLKFTLKNMPMFLEGAVKYLKLPLPIEDKKAVYAYIKKSNLYDDQLTMYKVNESLMDTSFEIGRTRAFTPGWLENESIWLHMEYKYLLEILKSGLYDSFIEDFQSACVAFLDPKVYGRSVLENSSFIASSVNPDKKVHGKGFVARLSGSTVEFIHMWQIMMFGLQPFRLCKNELTLKFEPFIPEYLIGENKQIKATFLGNIKVIYHMARKSHVIPGFYKIKEYILHYKDQTITKSLLKGQTALDIRKGLVKQIDVIVDNSC